MTRILVADDLPQVRSALRLFLEYQIAGCTVDEVGDTQGLLAQVQVHPPDLVLVDWELPDLTKTNLLGELRQNYPWLLIVVLSGQAEAYSLALAAGADAFVSKGQSPEYLLAILEKFNDGGLTTMKQELTKDWMTQEVITVSPQVLSEHPFLQGLKPAYLDFIAECATEKQFSAGEYMLREGNEANEFYLILQGKVALGSFVTARGFTTIQTMNHHEMVGWSWLIPPYRWRFSVLVIMSTQAIALDGKRLRERGEADPEFGYELLKRVSLVIGQRLTATRVHLETYP